MRILQPTPYSDLNQILADLLQGMQNCLGPNLIGLYLQGSFALGDFDEHSDLDFVAITQQKLTKEQAQQIEAVHKRIFDQTSNWGKHLEGSYFSRRQLLGPTKKLVWYFDHGSTKIERSNHCNTLVVRWTLYHHGIALYGPDIKTLVRPVWNDDLRNESRQTLIGWGEDILKDPEAWNNRFYQGLIVFTICRVLHTVETGQVHSKRASAAWSKSNLRKEYHALIDRSWSTRQDPYVSSRTPADSDDFALTLALLKLSIQKLSIKTEAR